MNLKNKMRNTVLKRAIIPCSVFIAGLKGVLDAPARRLDIQITYQKQAEAMGWSEPLCSTPSVESLAIPYAIIAVFGFVALLVALRGIVWPQKTKIGKSILRYVTNGKSFKEELEEANNDLQQVQFRSKGIWVGKKWLIGRVWPFGYKMVKLDQLIGVYRCDFTYTNYKRGTTRVEHNILFLDKDKNETKIIVGSDKNRENVYFYFYNLLPDIAHGNYSDRNKIVSENSR
ncbi:DUF6709 family protein [Anaerosporobacter faecicola]|uniref:DUF6709 family protein n=1 Tax=Anaerosporobacter faecicola TaxID=2718714 RepID=UPI00143A736A|nr:DUF6709 family protein [Anaerosporobacter faecicola]